MPTYYQVRYGIEIIFNFIIGSIPRCYLAQAQDDYAICIIFLLPFTTLLTGFLTICNSFMHNLSNLLPLKFASAIVLHYCLLEHFIFLKMVNYVLLCSSFYLTFSLYMFNLSNFLPHYNTIYEIQIRPISVVFFLEGKLLEINFFSISKPF